MMMDQTLAGNESTSIILAYAVQHLFWDVEVKTRLAFTASSFIPQSLTNEQEGDNLDYLESIINIDLFK
jgi:hypothetical protein